jgi:hypothetical protein
VFFFSNKESPVLPLLPNTKRATRNNADTTAQDARDRAERIVDAAFDRARRSALSAAEAEAKAPATKRDDKK